MTSIPGTTTAFELHHFYYLHSHPVSNITQGKVMMDVCKSFAYACGAGFMKLQDGTYNSVNVGNTKKSYSHFTVNRTMETLVRKGMTVYTLYGFLPDICTVDVEMPNQEDKVLELRVFWYEGIRATCTSTRTQEKLSWTHRSNSPSTATFTHLSNELLEHLPSGMESDDPNMQP